MLLDDITVSRKHVILKKEEKSCRLIDAGSLNGSYLNGNIVEEAVLQGGFGSSILEFLQDHDYTGVSVSRMGIPDHFIEHGNVDELLNEIHITADELVVRIQNKMNKTDKAGTHAL